MDILNVSDLQISLIIIGIIIIAGVLVFNWVQQSRYQREVQEAFECKHTDVLLDEEMPTLEKDRVEPKFSQQFMNKIQLDASDSTVGNQDNGEEPVDQSVDTLVNKDQDIINYIVRVQAEEVIPDEQLSAIRHHQYDFGKPVHWYGKYEKDDAWEEITLELNPQSRGYMQLKGCLQLVDRSGPVSELSLSRFRDLAEEIASERNVTANCPDIMKYYEQAVLLDKFCADVDVMIGINIISNDEGAFVGTKIRALAEASGFKLEDEGEFKYHDENGLMLFALINYEDTPFTPENMKLMTTHGITFLLDVPRVERGERVFEQMTHIARIFSSTLGGIMVDDNRVPLSDNGIARSKKQLNDIKMVMESNSIPAGSEDAMKLFV